MYPGSSGTNTCTAPTEYADGRFIYCLKPEYLTVNTSGGLDELDATNPLYVCNGYSIANALSVKQHSSHQYITISCNNWTTKGDVLCSSSTNRAAAVTQIVSLVQTCNFDGAELDFEPFGNSKLSATQWTNYKTFINQLGTALHASDLKLMIDCPSINTTDSPFLPSLYRFVYADLNSLPVDYIVCMAYDSQWNYTMSSTDSISPNTFVQHCCDYMLANIADSTKIILGMPGYSFHATDGGDSSDGVVEQKVDSALRTGFASATRNGDSEMNWLNSGIRSFYQDGSGLTSKRGVIEAKGIKQVAMFALGGNDYPNGSIEPSARRTTVRSLASARSSSSRTLTTTRRLI